MASNKVRPWPDRLRDYQRELYHLCRKFGVCVRCKRWPVEEGRACCSDCASYRRERQRAYAERRRRKGGAL